MKLSKLQQEILDDPYDKIVVLAAAASGKTRLMTEKVRQLLRAGVNPKTIAVITFTNIAATELRQRLGEDYKDGLFVGTIHSLANNFLTNAGISTENILKDSEFDELFKLVKNNTKCIRQIDYIILDEAQDTDKSQFEFLFDMINPPCFFVCGDIRQSIYGFRNARPDLLLKLSLRDDVNTYDMNENYRNGYNILNLAKKIIEPTGYIDTSVSKTGVNGSVARLPLDLDLIKEKIEEDGEYKDWAILTRTNSDVADVCNFLQKNGIPFDSFKQKDLTKDELFQKMEQDTVKVLTVHSAKGLEWNNVIVIGVRLNSTEERNVGYVAVTRAKEQLIWMYKVPQKRKKTKMHNWG